MTTDVKPKQAKAKDATKIAKENAAAVVHVAKEQSNTAQDGIQTLPSGIQVRYHSVAANLIRDVQSRILEPIVPTYPNPDDPTKTFDNPSSPTYLADVAAVTEQRAQAGMDAMLMFGLELISPMPTDDTWLQKLIVLKLIEASEIETADEFTKKLWYKKYVVADAAVLKVISKLSGVTQEEIAKANASFQGNA